MKQEIANSLNERLYSTIGILSSEISSLKSQVCSLELSKILPNPAVKRATISASKQTSQVDRSTNVIFFGIPEQNFLTTRALVDEICEYLSGKVVSIKDLFRLGKHPPPGEGSDPTRPRPVLVKVTTIWDKQLLLLSKQKLKV